MWLFLSHVSGLGRDAPNEASNRIKSRLRSLEGVFGAFMIRVALEEAALKSADLIERLVVARVTVENLRDGYLCASPSSCSHAETPLTCSDMQSSAYDLSIHEHGKIADEVKPDGVFRIPTQLTTQVYDPGYGGYKPGVPIPRTACASASWCCGVKGRDTVTPHR